MSTSPSALVSKAIRVVYQPEAEVYHDEGSSSGTDLNSGVKQHQVKNQQVFFQKWQSVVATSGTRAAESQQMFGARDRSLGKKQIAGDRSLPAAV